MDPAEVILDLEAGLAFLFLEIKDVISLALKNQLQIIVWN
jgi:hypothetical protein